jgi:hypothetical protein
MEKNVDKFFMHAIMVINTEEREVKNMSNLINETRNLILEKSCMITSINRDMNI